MESFKYKGTPEQMAKVAEWALRNEYNWYDDDRTGECLYVGDDGDIFYTRFYSEDLSSLPPALELEIFGKTDGITGKVENEWVENDGEQPVGDMVKVDVKYVDQQDVFNLYASLFWWDKRGADSDISHWRLHKSDGEYFQEPKTEKSLEDAYDEPSDNGGRTLIYNFLGEDSPRIVPPKRNKYSREIKPGVFCDVYDVLRAFNVTDPCLQHAAKKMLACGVRGHKDATEDYADILASVTRAVELNKEWNKCA